MKVPVFEPSVSSLIDCLPEKEFEITHILDSDWNCDPEVVKIRLKLHGKVEFLMHLGDKTIFEGITDKGFTVEGEEQYYVLYFTNTSFLIVKGKFKKE